MAMEDLAFIKGFTRMCDDGWLQGWHERNGGNLTYRMTDEEVEQARPFFDDEPRAWVKMGVRGENLAGSYFVTTGSGKYMRNVMGDPAHNIGIVQINEDGDSFRIVWGLLEGARPTSEFESHYMNHCVTAARTDGANRVIYHAHTPGIIEMSFIVPLTDRAFTRRLWQMMTECVVVFPAGVGVVPWMVPGGPAIAEASSELMKTYDTIVWAHHGLFAAGPDFDTTFGLAHTVEKAAQLYVAARAANGGSEDWLNKIEDKGLIDTCHDFNIAINEAFVD
ncbi:MAG: rhamnulose-1-phosphate aldolase [Atopobiaceae bacterium]|nr:rhamnulose-1-phosphate aldolase [Atopobiaceae bacterium]